MNNLLPVLSLLAAALILLFCMEMFTENYVKKTYDPKKHPKFMYYTALGFLYFGRITVSILCAVLILFAFSAAVHLITGT